MGSKEDECSGNLRLTFSNLDLDTGVTFGHVLDTSHNLGHFGGVLVVSPSEGVVSSVVGV